MTKGPLITRSELRKRQQEKSKESLINQRREELAYQQKEKKIVNFYRKEGKKDKPIKTRTNERAKIKKWNSFLMTSLIIVILLLCAVFLAILFV